MIRKRPLERAFLWAALAAASLFYAWTPSSYSVHWFSRTPTGFYNELCDAFLNGQVSLKRQPDPRLIALADPYDPALNVRFRVNDLSYYKGRYFLYMGPAPAIALFVPVRLVTGSYISQEAASVIFCVFGLGASLAFISSIRRHCFPKSPLALVLASTLSLALAGGYYVAVRGAIAQQVAISCAFSFSMLSLWACANAAFSDHSSKSWFAVASLAIGIAIAARPNYVFSSALLLPPFILWWRQNRTNDRSHLCAAILCALLPLGVVVATILAYNYARFGRPLEFGAIYQLGNWNQLHLASSGLGNAGENAWRYLFAPAVYSTFFPFAATPSWMAVGVLRHVPWLWLLPIGAFFVLRKTCPKPALALGASALILACTNLLTLIFLPSGNPAAVLTSANQRYLLDFLPALTVVAAVGAFAAENDPFFKRARLHATFLSLLGALCAASILMALSFDFQRFPEEYYRPLANLLDLPTYATGLLSRDAYGPLAINLTFPTDRTGSYEPLLTTGRNGACDLIYVNYTSKDHVRFGFVGTGLIGPRTEVTSIDPTKPHRLEVSMGSLYPPIGHPLFSRLDSQQASYLKRNLRLVLDGILILEAPVYCNPSSPHRVELGRNSLLSGYSSTEFSGRILSAERLNFAKSLPAQVPAPSYGPISMVVRFPRDRTPGTSEPLVVTGVPKAGDFAFVRYLGGNRIQFGIDHWGSAEILSPEIPIDVEAEHSVRISLGSLFPPASYQQSPHNTQIDLDGRRIVDARQETFASSPYDVTVARNAIGGSTCTYRFTGNISSVTRLPPYE